MAMSKLSHHPKFVLLALILLFLIPLLLAWILYDRRYTFGKGMVNHGHLITPPFAIDSLKFYDAKSQLLIKKVSNGKWLMLYLNPGSCNKLCQRGLHNLRQIRTATGKNRNRIERAIVTYQQNLPNPRLIKLLNQKYQGTKLFITSKQSFETTVAKNVSIPYAVSQGSLYIVDPHGNVMMVYKSSADPIGIFKDLQRLLKASQIG